MEARKLVKLYERQNQLMNSNNFLNFSYGKSSNWDRSKKLMIKRSDNKDRKSVQTKEHTILTQTTMISKVDRNVPTKITISSPTKLITNKTQFSKLNKLVRSNSGLYLSNKTPTSPCSPTGGVRRKLMNPTSILKKQMSIDSLTIQTTNLNLNQQAKSPTKQSTNLLQPFDSSMNFDLRKQNFSKQRKPISAPASSGLRSNPELNK